MSTNKKQARPPKELNSRFAVKPSFFQTGERVNKKNPKRVYFEVGAKVAYAQAHPEGWTSVCPLSNEWTGKTFRKLKDAMTFIANHYDCLKDTTVQMQILEPSRMKPF